MFARSIFKWPPKHLAQCIGLKSIRTHKAYNSFTYYCHYTVWLFFLVPFVVFFFRLFCFAHSLDSIAHSFGPFIRSFRRWDNVWITRVRHICTSIIDQVSNNVCVIRRFIFVHSLMCSYAHAQMSYQKCSETTTTTTTQNKSTHFANLCVCMYII